jgi:hypothetical protein
MDLEGLASEHIWTIQVFLGDSMTWPGIIDHGRCGAMGGMMPLRYILQYPQVTK